MNLLRSTDRGLYCPAGDFFIDPSCRVDRAVITHAHSDHAVPGSRRYLACAAGQHILTQRLGDRGRKVFLAYGQTRLVNGVKVSFHPAGHVLGSAQVRLEYRGHVWVVSGDYKLEADPTCARFESVRCDVFVTESTFGLPVYRWPDPGEVFAEINQWWRENQLAGRTSVIYAYALGKAQRILASIDASIGPIHVHRGVQLVNEGYLKDGVVLPSTQLVPADKVDFDWSRALIIALPSAHGTPWLRQLGNISTAMASGWMRVRGTRRRRSVDRGFVLSDHVDWPGLLQAVGASGAKEVWVNHGYTELVARYLESQGYETRTIEARVHGKSQTQAARPGEDNASSHPLLVQDDEDERTEEAR